MKLIDADALLDELRNTETSLARKGVYLVKGECNLYKVIKEQPTAYDVGKVISEIDKCSIDNTDWGYSTNPKLSSYYLSRTAEVIDIVKRGGIDGIYN